MCSIGPTWYYLWSPVIAVWSSAGYRYNSAYRHYEGRPRSGQRCEGNATFHIDWVARNTQSGTKQHGWWKHAARLTRGVRNNGILVIRRPLKYKQATYQVSILSITTVVYDLFSRAVSPLDLFHQLAISRKKWIVVVSRRCRLSDVLLWPYIR